MRDEAKTKGREKPRKLKPGGLLLPLDVASYKNEKGNGEHPQLREKVQARELMAHGLDTIR